MIHSLFCHKNVLQKEIKDWTFKACLLTEETSSWFPLIESLKITCARSILCMVLEFLSNGKGLDCFLQHNLPKRSKRTVTCPKQYKGTNRVNSDLPKVSKIKAKWPLWKSICLHSRRARNIEFGQLVNITERVPFGTPPLAVVMTLAPNHATNLFMSSYRGVTVVKFGQ